MRDYQPKKSKYLLPASVWHRTLWLIRDHDRLQSEANQLINIASRSMDALPGRQGTHSDPVGNAVIKRDRFLKDVAIIEKALERIPEEYRKGVWQSIQGGSYPLDADRCTYSRWKSKYIYDVAAEMGYI